MKPKFNQKLSLNKKTIANLRGAEMKNVKGGITAFYETCTCESYCCTGHTCVIIGCDTEISCWILCPEH
jgi:natural product precursor